MARLWKKILRLIAMVSLLLAFFGVDASKKLPTPASVLGSLPSVVAPAPVPSATPAPVAPGAPPAPAAPLKHNISSCATGDGRDAANHHLGWFAVCVVDGTQMNIGTWATREEAREEGIREFRRVHGK